MKLDRNLNASKRGKYALILLREAIIRKLNEVGGPLMIDEEHVDFGGTPETDFFVIRLKDKYAAPALAAYAMAAYEDDQEYGLEVLNLAKKAAEHPGKRRPD